MLGTRLLTTSVLVAVVAACAGTRAQICPAGTQPACFCPQDVGVPTPEPPPPSAQPTASPTAAVTALPTASPTAAVTALPTASPTAAVVTALPTASPTAAVVTALPTASPTAAVTALPTASPTAAVVTALPTASPTASPTACTACPLGTNGTAVVTTACGREATCGITPSDGMIASSMTVVIDGAALIATADAPDFDSCELGPDDQFGHSLAATGDLDGDGVPDVLVGAPGHEEGRGTVFMLTLNADGTAKSCRDLVQPLLSGSTRKRDPEVILSLGTLAGLGFSTSYASSPQQQVGTVNMLAGAPFASGSGGPDTGGFYGMRVSHPDGITEQHYVSDASADLAAALGTSLDAFGQYGGALAFAGDVDGDGTGDIIAGYATADASAGRVDVLFMNDDFTVRNATRISAGVGGLDSGAVQSGDEFGRSVAYLGDLNGDTFPDYGVGAPGANGTEGALHIVSLAQSGAVVEQARIRLNNAFRRRRQVGVGGPGAFFGLSVTLAGDVDADGIRDIAIGAPADGLSPSAILIALLHADLSVKEMIEVGPNAGSLGMPTSANAGFGFSVAALGTVNGATDRTMDFIVGAPFTDDSDVLGAQAQGAAYTLFGAPVAESVCSVRTDASAGGIGGELAVVLPATQCTTDAQCENVCACATDTMAAQCATATAP